MTQPGIKKNPDGTWRVTGVQERILTQTQADYQDIVKASQLITGEQGANARALIVQNPAMSGGLLASLSRFSPIANNSLVKTLTDIDAQTRAQRELDQYKEAQRISTQKFERTPFGMVWRVLKGFTLGAATVLEAPFEFIGAGARGLKSELDAWIRGDVDAFYGNPTDKTKTPADLGLDRTSGFSDFGQVKLVQAAKQLLEEGKIDLGSGFFPSEETGAGFLARQFKLDAAAVNVKIGNRTYQRPFSISDAAVDAITFGNADTGYGTIMSAVGDLYLMIKTDPFIAYSKIRNAIREVENIARTSSGASAAKAYQQKAILDAQLEEAAARTKAAMDELDAAVGPAATAKRETFLKALDEQVKIADEYDNISYSPEKIAGFLSSSMASPVIDWLADTNDWKQIWRIGKERGGRGGFTVEQSRSLAAATNREEVLEAIAPYIAKGQVVAGVLDTGTAAGKAMKTMLGSRIVPGKVAQVVHSVKGLGARGLRKMNWYNSVVKAYSTVTPTGKAIHSSDKDALIDAIYSYGRVTNVAESKLDELADIVALTDDASEAGFTASGRLFDEILAANVDKAWVNEELLTELTRIFRNGRSEMGLYWAQMHAAGAKLDYVMSGNKKVTISGPHLDSEYLNSVVYFPDAKEILSAISSVNKLGPFIQGTSKHLDFFTNAVWKRIVLVRPAYILRNIAEEQIRVLGTGHISFFNNPLMATAMWLGRDGGPKWRALLNRFDPFKNTVMNSQFKLGNAADELMAEELAHDVANSYVSYMSARGASGFDNDLRTTMIFSGVNAREYGHPRWWEGLANEIRILSNSVAGRAVARTGPTVDNQLATVDYLLAGAGKAEWTQFAKLQKPEIRDWLLSKEGAMAYLFTGADDKGRATSLLARIEEATGRGGEASQALKNLISYGKIQGDNFMVQVPKGKQSAENSIRNAAEVSAGKKALKDANQEFADILKTNFEGKGNWDGLLMGIPDAKYATKTGQRNRLVKLMDDFFDFAVKLEKTSTMGPEWRQSYWDAILSISKALDAEAVSRLSKAAKSSLNPLESWNGAPIGKEHAVWKAFKNAKGDGNITADEAHQYASMVASKKTADLFYDASRRRLLFHQLRIIAPFAAAWEDTIRRWGQISLNNPMEVYKIQKGLQWLTKPESGALYAMTDARDYYDPNQGFFFTDPQDGQRKLFIPFLGTGLNFLSNLFGGRGVNTSGPYAFAASPQSLNFVYSSGSLMPGVGPGMQISLQLLDGAGINIVNVIPNGMREEFEKIVFPYGKPNLAGGVLEGLILPNNWRRVLGIFPDQDAAYASAFAPTMNYLASGGNYDLNSLEGQTRLMNDTDKMAKWFTVFRGFFGMVSPFPLQPKGISTLDDGNVVLSTALFNDFKELEVKSGGDYNKAYGDFMDLYGPEAIFAIINTSAGAPTNLFTYELIQREPEVVDIYPDTYGYAYPTGGFSQELYRWQRRQGEKEKFTSEQLIQRATSIRYYAANDRLMARLVSGTMSEEEYEDARKNLRDTFIKAGLKIETDPYKQMRVREQLRRMATDDRFADSDAVTGLRDYLYLRDKALQAAGITNDSLAKDSAAPQREWLAGQAKQILQRNPEFYKFYYGFFKKELEG